MGVTYPPIIREVQAIYREVEVKKRGTKSWLDEQKPNIKAV